MGVRSILADKSFSFEKAATLRGALDTVSINQNISPNLVHSFVAGGTSEGRI